MFSFISRATCKGRICVDKAKPFGITKREVWEAYKRVKANRGTAGVDEQTIALLSDSLGEREPVLVPHLDEDVQDLLGLARIAEHLFG